MSAPPPPYQNQPPQQQYGYPQQQPYGQQPYGQQNQPYGQPQPPRGPQGPRRSPLRLLINFTIVIAFFGGAAWYVWDYNTDPHGGKHAEEAAASASAKAYNEKHNPDVGDCVKISGSGDSMELTVVDCGSPEAQYKTGEKLDGNEKCGPQYARSIVYSHNHRAITNWCFTKV